MKKEHSDLFKNGSECRICLQDIYGDDTPEMAIRILYQRGYSNEYFFKMGENDDIQYIGRTFGLDDYRFYSDGEENYIISKHFYEDRIAALIISRFGNVQPRIFCDAYEYSNSSADEFILNTQLTFCRFDEYFDADNEVPAEVFAEDFYYEDTGTYEAYLLSPEILELTGGELSEYRMPYNVGIQCYIAKRDEYSAVMDKLDDMMTELDIVTEFDSGWLEMKDLIPWLEKLQE